MLYAENSIQEMKKEDIVNKLSSNPLYEQVFNRIKDSVRSGEYKKGDLIPSEKELMELMGVSRVTVRQALKMLSDSGIIPGSGVGNHRAALNRETLGVPVIAVGVPTVVDAATLAADLLEESGLPEPDMETLRSRPENLMVTPRDIDQQVRDLGKVIGYGINWALQDLEIEEINALLS